MNRIKAPARACHNCPHRQRGVSRWQRISRHAQRFAKDAGETLTVELCVLVLIWVTRATAFAAVSMAILGR